MVGASPTRPSGSMYPAGPPALPQKVQVRVQVLVGGILGPCDLGGGRGHGQAQGAGGARLAGSPDGQGGTRVPRTGGILSPVIRNFGAIAAPLTALLKEGFRWNDVAERAFRDLQHALTTMPVLQLPVFD